MDSSTILVILILASIIPISIGILGAPQFIRRKNMRALAHEFGLEYLRTDAPPDVPPGFWRKLDSFIAPLDDIRNIVSGVVSGHNVLIHDILSAKASAAVNRFNIMGILYLGTFQWYTAGPRRTTIMLVDGKPQELPRCHLFTSTTPTRTLRKILQELSK